MEKITKIINLDKLKCKLPLTYPSVNGNKVSYVTAESIDSRPNANYNTFPLLLNESSINTTFSSFSKEMGLKYGGKTLDYDTIHEWFVDFQNYNKLLYSKCQKPFADLNEYQKVNGFTEELSNMELRFKERGGKNFYTWLCQNFFTCVDLIQEFYTLPNPQHTYRQWVACLDGFTDYTIPFNEAVKLHHKLLLLEKNNNCCESNLYETYGGDDMKALLGLWIEKVSNKMVLLNTNIQRIEQELIPNLSINLSLQKHMEDLGNFEPIVTEFTTLKDYSQNEVCLHDGKAYILKRGNGKKKVIDRDNNETWEFNETDWELYNNETNDFEYKPEMVLNGYSTSVLDDFYWPEETTDDMGNTLPCHYIQSNEDTIPQPVENSILDLEYQIGRFVKKGVVDNEYYGNYLKSVEVYAKDKDGNKKMPQVFTEELYDNQTTFSEEVYRLMLKISNDTNNDGIIYADFLYYQYVNFVWDGNKYRMVIHKNEKGENIEDYITCIEHCQLQVDTYPYYISKEMSYPIRYIHVIRPLETISSTEYGTNFNVILCEWSMKPYYFHFNPSFTIPAFRYEETLGFQALENMKSNIYIDRGYATVMDKHLKLNEIDSLDTLTTYGNGSFEIIDLERDSKNG